MIAQALFFYQFNSVKNRLLVRIRRMKEPRYLIGGIAGALYFYFYFYRAFHRSVAGATPQGLMTAHQPLFESLFALGFCVLLLLMWIFPHARAALTFTEAEVAFLFPAPVSRRQLINFKLLRLQTAVLFSSFFMALVGRFGSPHFYSGWVGWWLMLAVFNLHLIGSSFAVTMMMDRGISNWRRRAIFVSAIIVFVVGLAWWVHATFPPPPAVEANREAIRILTHYLPHALDSGPLHYLLYPFHLILAPFFARNATEFLLALPGAFAIVALHYLWVVGSNVAFEEASVEASRKQAERVSAMRSGNWQAGKARKASRSPFKLGASGFPAMALIWKNVIAAGNTFTIRFWIMAAWLVIFAGFIFRSNLQNGVDVAVTAFVGVLLAFSVLIGPNILRNDFRQDLPMTDLLKTLPLAGWQVALGEILAPVCIIVAAQWLLLLMALIFCPSEINHHPINLWLKLATGLGVALLLPAIDFANLLIRNLAVLTFPAWFQLGRDGARGFENTGQQLILVFGQVLALALALIPPAFAFLALWFSGSFMVGPAFAMIAACLAALAILVVEAVLAVRLLGSIFERLDLSSELLSPD